SALVHGLRKGAVTFEGDREHESVIPEAFDFLEQIVIPALIEEYGLAAHARHPCGREGFSLRPVLHIEDQQEPSLGCQQILAQCWHALGREWCAGPTRACAQMQASNLVECQGRDGAVTVRGSIHGLIVNNDWNTILG